MTKLREQRFAWAIELVLLALLLAFLSVAVYKFFEMLRKVGIPWSRGLPVGAIFIGAVVLTFRRMLGCYRRLRKRGGDDRVMGRHGE
jgi:uncharacterized BrkB/YihY/UPF0761 family membrane protein